MTKEDKIIERLKKKILDLGPMLPGSISKQYNVCGKAGCKCKNDKDPCKAWTILSTELYTCGNEFIIIHKTKRPI